MLSVKLYSNYCIAGIIECHHLVLFFSHFLSVARLVNRVITNVMVRLYLMLWYGTVADHGVSCLSFLTVVLILSTSNETECWMDDNCLVLCSMVCGRAIINVLKLS